MTGVQTCALPILVGYVARHIWDKKEIDDYNQEAKRSGKYQIRRYNNSIENEFSKLLYNYDTVIEGVTDTVIILEGVMDVIAITRKLELYDNSSIVPVATFGKKISDVQIFKLQAKGVKTVILGYDGDAINATAKIAEQLNEYFDTFVAYIPDPTSDFDSMDFWEIFDVFCNLQTATEFKLNAIQL